MPSLTSRIAAALVVLLAGACSSIQPPEGKSPLKRPRMSPDSVALDIFFVRVPFGDPVVNGTLWDEIDEQQLPSDLRRELACAGFRAGVVGGTIPEPLAKLLELDDTSQPVSEASGSALEDLASEPTVVRRHTQLRPGRPCEVQASGSYKELPVVTCQDDKICGQAYHDAQGILVVKTWPRPAGRVRLDLTPEIQHGPQRPQYAGTQGMLRMEYGRDRRVFSELALSAELAAGDMLVLGSLDNRPGSLGDRFLTQETDGRREQKLLVVRLSTTQHDDLFERPRQEAENP